MLIMIGGAALLWFIMTGGVTLWLGELLFGKSQYLPPHRDEVRIREIIISAILDPWPGLDEKRFGFM